MPRSNTSNSGKIPRRDMRRASSPITCGLFIEAWPEKFNELSVNEPMSGFKSPSKSKGSARSSISEKSRPLSDTQTIRSEACRRMPSMIRA